MPYRISRQAYAETYGPTTGDRLRLADTELILEVEQDRPSAANGPDSASATTRSRS